MVARRNTLRFVSGKKEAVRDSVIGKRQTLRIERLAHDGRGIAHVDGRPWFVAGALPDEQIIARALVGRSDHVDACCERVVSASPQRCQVSCPFVPRCGGCTLQHMSQSLQLDIKERTLREQLLKFGGVTPQQWAEPLTGPSWEYRRRTRIAVRWNRKLQQLEAGFREAFSQTIVPVTDCLMLVAPLRALLRDLRSVLQRFSRADAIGHVELFQGDFAVLTLRHERELPEADITTLQGFCRQHKVQLWLWGKKRIQIEIEGVSRVDPGYEVPGDDKGLLRLQCAPGDFVQSNDEVNRAMIRQSLEWLVLEGDERILDLFCGVGNFTLPLALRGGEVLGLEGSAAMVQRTLSNARLQGLDNVTCRQANLMAAGSLDFLASGRVDVVLLDPPRDGALQVVRQLVRLKPRRVLYISCNSATLARDSGILKAQGYRLKRAGILDMFPHTAHFEAMALFERLTPG